MEIDRNDQDAPKTPANTCPEDGCAVESRTPEAVTGHVQRNHSQKKG